MNLDAVSKNVKILKIGLVEQKLWKIRQTVGSQNHKFMSEIAQNWV